MTLSSSMAANRDIPGRPKRLSRIYGNESYPLYFVTISTFDRRPILDSDMVHDTFVAHAEGLLKRNIAVGRYVIMPDHIHLFVRIGPGEKLGLTVKHLKEKITKALACADHSGNTWQPGFFDHLLRSSDNYREKWQYVLLNPVRAGLVNEYSGWVYQGEICAIDRV